MFLKWVKNLQKTGQSQVILLPCMNNPWLCRVNMFQTLFCSLTFKHSDSVMKTQSSPLTESLPRKRFQLMLNLLDLPTDSLTYHCLFLPASVFLNVFKPAISKQVI